LRACREKGPGLVAAAPDSFQQSTQTGSIEVSLDGGYYGTSSNGVNVTFAGTGVTKSVQSSARKVILSQNNFQLPSPGLYEATISSNPTQGTPQMFPTATTNVAVQPAFATAPVPNSIPLIAPGQPARYQVSGRLCTPAGPPATTVQVLVHGLNFSSVYWDFPLQPNRYSYVRWANRAGYATFKRYGCVACHQGVNVGGNMFQKFGVMGDYFEKRGNPTQADLGRYLVTGLESDKHVFKVPSLRNVALTAPYFHDASAKTLEDAVDIMFRYQLGRVASKEDKDAIVRFLNTLTGELEATP